MNLLIGITFISLVFYAVLIIRLLLKWRSFPEHSLNRFNELHGISIIIPVRNEAANIKACIQAIGEQDYSRRKFEVIFVNDHSTDQTPAILAELLNTTSFQCSLYHLKDKQGKKSALELGIEKSHHELVITTDADCIMGPRWLSSFGSLYAESKPKLIAGPVIYENEKNGFEKLQSLDFFAMMSFGAAAFANKTPMICNGANLFFEKKAFYSVNGYHEKFNTPSGDDVFLLQKMKKHFSEEITFLKSPHALVFTKPEKNVSSFLSQKLRWASKSKYYRGKTLIFTSLLMAVINFLLLCGMILLFSLSPFDQILFLAIFFTKILLDTLFLKPFLRFFDKKKLILYLVPLQLFYPIYITGMSVFSPFLKFSWKGRISN